MAPDAKFLFDHAYLPEHVAGYVTAVSNAEPYMEGSYLYYVARDLVIFIGYPLGEPFERKQMDQCLDAVVRRFRPRRVSLMAPQVHVKKRVHQRTRDTYYRLNLAHSAAYRKVRNDVRRASVHLDINKDAPWTDEHSRLVAEFLSYRKVSKETEHIFSRIPDYLASSPTATVMDARKSNGRLVAFDVAEFASKEYAFYMFNVISRNEYVPGSSDLLFAHLTHMARERDKRYINLGLGINQGVRFFKRKWGGVPFLEYEHCLYETGWMHIIEDLSRRL